MEATQDTSAIYPGGTGVASYTKIIRNPEKPDSSTVKPIRRAQLEVRDTDGFLVASMFTNERGEYEYPASNTPLQITVRAYSRGPRVNAGVYRTVQDATPWSFTGNIGEPDELIVSEPYAAGAFNVIELANQTGDALEGLVGDAPAPEVRVIWNDSAFPACGSCFYFSAFRLELTGAPGDIDAHDDDVVLHELAHYVEAAYGDYGNPGGYHEVAQQVVPELAWSEGFATWFSSWIRQSPQYRDIQPGGYVYELNLETLQGVTLGVSQPGNPSSNHSEGIVFGLLWDLVDDDAGDDTAEYDGYTILSTALDPLAMNPTNLDNAEFNSWLMSWQCTIPASADDLSTLTANIGFPYNAEATKALCSP
jgi:hypothetical protein